MSAFTVFGDWGTTRLRLWRLQDGKPPLRADGPGMGTLTRSPADTLRAAIAPLLSEGPAERIVLCGMAGARSGLHEVSYVECPASQSDWQAATLLSNFEGTPLRLAAGLACRSNMGVPDVMRGEETQIFGAAALEPRFGSGQHLIVLPGTHSKWVRLDNGRITGFRTFVTGELFSLLRKSSLVGTGVADNPGDEALGFAHGMERAWKGSGLHESLFEARAAQLRDGRSESWAFGFLSGLVITTEIVGMISRFEAKTVLIIGDPQLSARYERALTSSGTTTGVSVVRSDGDSCVIAGLRLLDAND